MMLISYANYLQMYGRQKKLVAASSDNANIGN